MATGRQLAVCLPGHHGQSLVISSDGHYIGTPRIEGTFVYVVQTDNGQETFTPEEFSLRYDWKSNPAKVTLEHLNEAPSKPEPAGSKSTELPSPDP